MKFVWTGWQDAYDSLTLATLLNDKGNIIWQEDYSDKTSAERRTIMCEVANHFGVDFSPDEKVEDLRNKDNHLKWEEGAWDLQPHFHKNKFGVLCKWCPAVQKAKDEIYQEVLAEIKSDREETKEILDVQKQLDLLREFGF